MNSGGAGSLEVCNSKIILNFNFRISECFCVLYCLFAKITIINKHLNKCTNTNLRWRQHVFQDPFVHNSVLIFWVLYCIKIIPRHRLHVCCKVYDRVRRRPATPVPAHTCPHAARAGKWRGNEYSEPRVGGHGHTLLPAHWRFWWQQPRIIFLLAKMVENYPLSTTPTAVYTFIFFSAEKVESLLKSLGTHTDMGERVHNECWIPA